jgi:hypothetical protein
MPAKAIDRLSAYAAESRTLRACALAIGRWWCSECRWQSRFATIPKPPRPGLGRSAPRGERSCQAIGTKRMGAPIGIDCEPRRRRYERAAERPRQNSRWEYMRQRLGEARKGSAISFRLLLLPFGHSRPTRAADGNGAIEAVKVWSPPESLSEVSPSSPCRARPGPFSGQ